MLEEAGIAVCLVNPRHVKNVPGRKTDVQDCQWLQYLHSVGLLRAAFRADAEIRPLRVLWRHRDALVCQSAWHIHKALDQMNVQIHHAIADITGVTGTAIVEAILVGQRDPAHLAALRDKRIKSDLTTLTRALTGITAPSICFACAKPTRASTWRALRFLRSRPRSTGCKRRFAPPSPSP